METSMKRASSESRLQDLFRHEAIAANGSSDLWMGLEPAPKTNLLLGAAVSAAFVVGIVAMNSLSFTEWADVSGELTVKAGLSDVRSGRSGVMSEILKRAGSEVRAGEIVAYVQPVGEGAQDRQEIVDSLQSIGKQLAALNRSKSLLRRRAMIDRANAEDVGIQAEQEAASLRTTLAEQQNVVRQMEERHGAKVGLLERGFTTKAEVLASAQNLALERQRLAEFRSREFDSRTMSRRQVRLTVNSTIDLETELNRLEVQDNQLLEQQTRMRSALATPVRAGMMGTMARYRFKVGEYVQNGESITSVLPPGGDLEVRLLADARTASLVKSGDIIKVSLDPFPYQQFGWLNATVSYVDELPREPSSAAAAQPPQLNHGYRIVASIKATSLAAYGQNLALRPGTPVTAELKVRRQSILRWLIDPLGKVFSR